MGNCNFQSEKQNDSAPAINKNNFQFHYIIGKGGFGKVWKIQLKKNRQLYAMKEMQKARVISKRSVNSVMNERKLLTQLKHPFIVNMQYAFQDRQNLYLIMDLLTGGDLRYHMSRKRLFTEEQAKFFIGCILLGLEYLHTNGTLHRDIKPENLVFDQKGYLRITDFGIARVWNPDNAQDTSGTPGYMAPEVMCRQNHGVAVDYFPLGVIGYQCMFGKRPYLGRNRKQIRDHILAKQVQIKKHEVPQNWSLKAADFINKLLQRKPVNRLGLNGPSQVKSHQWFSDFPWQRLYRKELPSPFVPDNEDNFSKSVTQQNWKQNTQVMRQNTLLLRRQSIQQMFSGYYFDINQGPQQYNLPKKTHANSTTSSQAQTGPMSPQFASGPTTAASTINRNDSKIRSTIKEPSSGGSSTKYRIDKGTYQI